jgi:hypothetical protein
LLNLRSLNLSNTAIGDGAVGSLSKLRGLVRLDLTDCNVTGPAVKTLQKALPTCHITSDSLPEGKAPASNPLDERQLPAAGNGSNDTRTGKATSDDGFVALFNGENLRGWNTPANTGWSYSRSGIERRNATNSANLLCTERQDFLDFHFRCEAMLGEGSYAGLTFRRVAVDGQGFKQYEAAIGGAEPRAFEKQPGNLSVLDQALLREATEGPVIKPGEWFLEEIIARGNRITIKIAGRTVAQYDEPRSFTAGPIGFLIGPHCTARIRKIEIKELRTAKGAN